MGLGFESSNRFHTTSLPTSLLKGNEKKRKLPAGNCERPASYLTFLGNENNGSTSTGTLLALFSDCCNSGGIRSYSLNQASAFARSPVASIWSNSLARFSIAPDIFSKSTEYFPDARR